MRQRARWSDSRRQRSTSALYAPVSDRMLRAAACAVALTWALVITWAAALWATPTTHTAVSRPISARLRVTS
jgi:hypothetical protein